MLVPHELCSGQGLCLSCCNPMSYLWRVPLCRHPGGDGMATRGVNIGVQRVGGAEVKEKEVQGQATTCLGS